MDIPITHFINIKRDITKDIIPLKNFVWKWQSHKLDILDANETGSEFHKLLLKSLHKIQFQKTLHKRLKHHRSLR